MHLILLGIAFIAIAFGPGLWVRRVLDTYSVPADRYSRTGAELARALLDRHALQSVTVEITDQGDHYDPAAKAVRLTRDKFDGRSLTAITVAAHEVGHAVQDAEEFAPLRMRGRLVAVARKFEKAGAALLMISPFIGAFTRAPAIGILMFLGGLMTLGTATLVHFVTLPTEIDASFNRALPMLEKGKILRDNDRQHARRILKAAALTYVAASLMSLLNVARWWAILRR